MIAVVLQISAVSNITKIAIIVSRKPVAAYHFIKKRNYNYSFQK